MSQNAALDTVKCVPPSSESATRRRTRQAVIDAAATVLIRRRDATFAEIALAADTSRSTVHRYFADRNELLRAVVTDSLETIHAATEHARLGEGSSAEAMRRVVAVYLDIGDRIRFLFADPSFAAQHPAVADLAKTDGPMVELIRRGQADGTFASELSPNWIERTLWSLIYAASEAIEEGALPHHEALATLLHTVEHGITT